ncbi:adenylate/guanylate cyclase domain-containing protein [Roseibium alexandrii]|uniref:Adenylate cyclase, family 3 (Some protein containing HAMP domain) n=1 Tax=Roseibium alexandrii (strain DSM 17067 / NCIMB 14079 / DFL-11) TaxID=244592 RepID=A0A5E8H4W9_ROSAD|nr:adenylate/guanylate cyclase domain-containing protein [Roseibium alexandrii]EEE47629.1 Adenylate cyclase, family 3 (some protein containing HAMP domain) [Roseibium alexandrii DFL-11]
MIDMMEIDGIEDWLIGEALGDPDMTNLFAELCERLRQCHVPVDRAILVWSTLHPMIEAEIAFWENGGEVYHEKIEHSEEDTEDWLQSPIRAVLINEEPMLRRRLANGNAQTEFPLLKRLASEGYTDYLVIPTHMEIPAIKGEYPNTGIILSWATREEDGFSEDALNAIHYIQKRLALAARAVLQGHITKIIAETYLGSIAGTKVLNGQIRHGDGETIDAVIFYSDMRNSTAIADALGPEDYLKWLNTYFEATAGAVLQQEGEVLDFIGDAVLGVFPTQKESLSEAVQRAITAADETRRRLHDINKTVSTGHKIERRHRSFDRPCHVRQHRRCKPAHLLGNWPDSSRRRPD